MSAYECVCVGVCVLVCVSVSSICECSVPECLLVGCGSESFAQYLKRTNPSVFVVRESGALSRNKLQFGINILN